jgi:hypothetical protein
VHAAHLLRDRFPDRQLFGDRLGQANALTDLGVIRWRAADYPGAVAALEEALGIFRDLGDRLGHANAFLDLGTVRWLTGNYPAAAAAEQERRWVSMVTSVTGTARRKPSTGWEPCGG